MYKLMASVVVVLATTAMVSGAGMEIVSKTIDAAPGQQVLVMATGTGAVRDVNLQLQVGDGGGLIGGTDVGGVDAAPITDVSFRLNGSIWADKGAALEVAEANGLVAFPSFSLAIGGVPSDVPGVLATIIMDGTGLAPGLQFPLSLSIPAAGALSDWGSGGAADSLVDGVITVIPEPASALLLLGAVPFLRRRRA